MKVLPLRCADDEDCSGEAEQHELLVAKKKSGYATTNPLLCAW
jgi:hypothetical protein